MTIKRPLYGPHDPRGPSRGRDVKDFVKRTLARLHGQIGVGEDFFPKPTAGFDDVYNAKTAEAVRVVQQWYEIRPATGNMGAETFDVLWAHADAYSKWVYRTWTAPKPKPVLVEPTQGWASLDKALWKLYSTGRTMGLEPDLGTYNAASTLPSGGPSDHSVYPANAFDLGFDPDIGFAHPVAKAFFHVCRADPACGYVILGDRIWSRARASEGVRPYTAGGHLNHVHVSGL